MVDARARLPAEFRTLSIHAETKTSTDDGASSTGTIKDLLALDWHKISADEVLQRLNVSPNMGLETVQAQRRLQANGRNVISGPKNKKFRKLFEWLLGGFGSLLFAASLLAFIAWKPLGEPEPQTSNLALAVVLLMVVAFQTALNAWQDFSTSKVVSSIKGMLPSDVLVFRDGSQVEIPAADLVTGDLVCIAMGEKVPADLRLTKVSGDLLFDRSILTGESEPTTGRVENTDDNFLQVPTETSSHILLIKYGLLKSKNIALQGTHCVGGSGVGVVIQTGDDTAFGRIAKLSSAESTGSTTLQREILHIVLIIASIAALVAIMLVVLWVSWLRRSFPSYINVSDLLVDIVSIMVGVMPVGL
ncbi:hypothetical protein AcV5_004395 [Taiwanofungus camphoratus]|nr:hypothetical protein AcV5_004395 [Antrodia cinnamomea]